MASAISSIRFSLCRFLSFWIFGTKNLISSVVIGNATIRKKMSSNLSAKKSIISILLCVCIVFSIVAFSFAPVYADDNNIYSRSNNKYSFTELFHMFMSNVVGWGTLYTSSDIQLLNIPGADSGLYQVELTYVLGVYKYDGTLLGDLKTWLNANSGARFTNLTWEVLVDKNGYRFYVNQDMNTVIVSNGSITWRHTFNINGNVIQNGGGSSGVSRENNYYTQSTNNNYNYDYGTTIETQILDSSNHTMTNISDGSVVNFGSGYIAYSPENKTYYAFDTTDNKYYTTVNNYTYNTVNYYMPGSDVPLSTYNYFYELPDGRNSATLTPDDVRGMNYDFDVVSYQQYATDPYQQALFHFNGNLYNSSAFSPISIQYLSFSPSNLSFTRYNLSSFVVSGNTLSLTRSSSGTAYAYVDLYLNSGDYTFYIDQNSPYRCNYYVGAFSPLVGQFVGNSGSYSFTVSGSNVRYRITCQIESSYSFDFAEFAWHISSNVSSGYGAGDGQEASGVNPTSFNWLSSSASYQFVDTQTDFDAALYVPGSVSSSAEIIVPTYTFSKDLDFTLQFRWYAELSTSSDPFVLRIPCPNNYLDYYEVRIAGNQIVGVDTLDNYYSVNASFSPGIWNTITIVRNSDYITLFLNGISVNSNRSSNWYFSDKIELSFPVDNNVHYLDEFVVFSDLALYTSRFVPRLDPWDSNLAFVVPSDVVNNSVAIQSTIPLCKFQLGGVRPSLPSAGDVYCSVEGDQVTSIQIFTGFMWQPTLGAIYYNGHWFNFDGFYIHQLQDDIDAPFIVPSSDPSGNGNGSGGSGFSFWELIYELIKPVINLLVSLVSSLASVLSSFFSTLFNLFSSIIQGIGNFFSFLSPLGEFFSSTWSAVPSDILGIVVGGFLTVVLLAVLKLFL